MDTVSSLLCLQRPSNSPYSETDELSLHTLQPYFHNIHFNIGVPSTPRSSECCLLLWRTNQNLVCTSCLSQTLSMPPALSFLGLILSFLYGTFGSLTSYSIPVQSSVSILSFSHPTVFETFLNCLLISDEKALR